MFRIMIYCYKIFDNNNMLMKNMNIIRLNFKIHVQKLYYLLVHDKLKIVVNKYNIRF